MRIRICNFSTQNVCSITKVVTFLHEVSGKKFQTDGTKILPSVFRQVKLEKKLKSPSDLMYWSFCLSQDYKLSKYLLLPRQKISFESFHPNLNCRLKGEPVLFTCLIRVIPLYREKIRLPQYPICETLLSLDISCLTRQNEA